MRKIFLFFLIVLTVFAFASCKQDPKPAKQTQKEKEPTTDEIIAAIVEPEWETGVLRVKSGLGAASGQSSKFQFGLNKSISEGQSIEFLAKFSDNAESLLVRQYEDPYTKYGSAISVDDFLTDEDGWYIVSVPGTDVCNSTRVAFTLYVESETWASSYVAIKDLQIGGVAVDLTALDEDEDVLSFVSAPDELDVLIVRATEE